MYRCTWIFNRELSI